MTTRQRIEQRWFSRSYAGEPTRDQETHQILEAVNDILSSGNEVAIGKLDQTVRILGIIARLRAEGYQPRIVYDQDDVPRAVVIDGKGTSPDSPAAV